MPTLDEILKKLETELSQDKAHVNNIRTLFANANKDIVDFDRGGDARAVGQVESVEGRKIMMSFNSHALSLMRLFRKLAEHDLPQAKAEAAHVKENVAGVKKVLDVVTEKDGDDNHKQHYTALFQWVSGIEKEFATVDDAKQPNDKSPAPGL